MLSRKVILSAFISLSAVVIAGGITLYFLFFDKSAVLVSENPTKRQEINALNFYNWWTSPGESAAINALVKVFMKNYPDVAIMPSAVVGGGGFSMMNTVKEMVMSGQAPDAFQMHAGYEGLPYYKAGLLDPVDDIWHSEKLEEVIPSVVQDMNKYDGKYYSVPVDIHRVNLVWYNKRLLDEYGISVSELSDWKGFFAACDKLKASGVEHPVRVGEAWTLSHAFEQFVASEGIDFYQDWINGKVLSLSNGRMLRVLENFKKYLSYADLNLTKDAWNEAIDDVKNGESAFMIMGDWANQEFKVSDKRYNIDYGVFPVPGTEDIYGLCVDTFQRPKNISHPTNADRWLRVVSSKEGQDAFNPLKGSISARTDADISRYDAYQQSAISDFWKSRYMFPSVVHGSGAPQEYRDKLSELISDFVINKDVNATGEALIAASLFFKDQYVINWSLK